MAYTFERPDSPYWWAGFVDEALEQQQESTKILVGTKPAERRQSSKDADRWADDREKLCRLRREGKAGPELVGGYSFDQLADKYLKESAAKLESVASIKSRIKHLRAYFGPRLIITILPGDVEAFTTYRLKTLPPAPKGRRKPMELPSPATVEHDRRLLRRMMNFALDHNLIVKNPVTPSTEIDVPEAAIRFLELDQVQSLLRHSPQHWRAFIAVALYCGLRKGEVIALRCKNVDLKRGVINVANSHGRATTKGGKPRVAPIPPELLPYLQVELGRARSEYLFPNPKGGRLSKHTKTEKIIRRAAVAAGLVEGYDHVCRRKGCGFTERRADDAAFRCPKCSMRLWVKAMPIDIKFKDTRSTWATHAYEATDDLRFVTDTLGHEDERITKGHYSAARLGHLTRQGAKISYDPLTLQPAAESGGAGIRQIHSQAQEVTRVRDEGVEPTTFGSGERGAGVARGRQVGHPLAVIGTYAAANSLPAASISTSSHPVSNDPLTIIPGAAEPLLTLPQVAVQLAVPVSTVRRLIWDDLLPAVRLGNLVRVRPADLAAFIAGGGA
jgi:integrase